MSLSQSTVRGKRLCRQLFLRVSSRHIPSLLSLLSTMVPLSRSLCPSGRYHPHRFASSVLFALPGIRESRRPEMQQLHFPKRRFWHALPGHAVLFRKEAVDVVGGYDVRYRRHHEDSDICHRMRKSGWETHYVAKSRCVSIQEDSLKLLAAKQLRDSGWYSPGESSLAHLYFNLSRWTLIRAGRNLLKGRLSFIAIEAALWVTALWMATVRTLHSRRIGGAWWRGLR
jgi:hypothetical protein